MSNDLGETSTKTDGLRIATIGHLRMARLAGVWAWGLGDSGELGNGGTSSRDVPVQVSGLTEVTAIAGFGNGGFALRP